MLSGNIGAGCLSTRPDVFRTRIDLIDKGAIGHIQVMMIPEDEADFRDHLQVYETMAGKIRIHAPHHAQQVNPCAPELYTLGTKKPVAKHIESAMEQTFEAADRTGSRVIVIHAGRFLPGHKEEAIEGFWGFLDRYPDRRYALENLCDLTIGLQYLGTTPDELMLLARGEIQGFCLDLPHLFCTAEANRLQYPDLLAGMQRLPLSFAHLSGTPGPDFERQHLFMNDPSSRLDIQSVAAFMRSEPGLEVSLELAVDDPTVIREQTEWCIRHL